MGDATKRQPVEVSLRLLAGHDDYHACHRLQLATWGRDFQEAVPPGVLKISQRVGGIAAGAFAADGRLLGFVYGLTGLRLPPPGGRPAELLHWSHMLAVAPEARDLGLGSRLKWFQRERLLELGVETMEWTYDPLEARNAHLNLNRLGGEVVEYVEDMYKGEMGSELARGIGTDRFVVAWRLRSPRVLAALAATAGDDASRFAAAPLVDPAPAAGEMALPAAPLLRIEIPPNIQRFKDEDPERALAYRLGTRRAFETYLARGYRVTAFVRDGAGRCFYGLEPAPPGAPS